MKPDLARERAGALFMSGPVGGVIGAKYAAELSGFSEIISLDMGGTSCDVSLIGREGLQIKSEHDVEWSQPLRIPTLDVVTIGAGGGSIARIDAGGALGVGPESAGADPGPVAYGKGGTEPTVTDANIVLGRLNPEALCGGAIEINAAAARAAILEQIARPLSFDLEEAAVGIITLANAKMVNAIREVSVERGYDPRSFALVAFGGAGPLHAFEIAEELGIPSILIPFSPGVLSAFGCMMSDVRFDFMQSILSEVKALDVPALNETVRKLEETGRLRLRDQGFRDSEIVFSLSADMRYLGQVHEVSVLLDGHELDQPSLMEAFHRAHERT